MRGVEILQTVVKDRVACRFFGGLMSIDRLYSKYKPHEVFYICNTDRWINSGKHWVIVYFINGHAEFFDPLGQPPSLLFSNFMMKYAKKINFNPSRVQPPNSQTCGEYCLFFASMRSRGVRFTNVLLNMRENVRVLDYVEDLKKTF
jgi:hypothetical protein